MTDYKNIPDEQVNRLVMESMGFSVSKDYAQWYEVYCDTWSKTLKRVPDYCNDWAAIGPVIEQSKVAIFPLFNGGAGWEASHGCKKHQRQNFRVSCSSPQRAAAICFLMMKEAGV